MITTKRGGSQYRGTSFYDFNNDSLNALTYNQTLAGVERGDPLSDTHEHRWGGSLGGPLIGGKLFFYGNYEGSNDKAIYGGSRANVPTEAMRAGDFRGTAINPIDPDTGAPFADQTIPAGRIDPAAKSVMDFFYPLPNRGTLANGYGVFQQFVPQTRKRHRADVRVDAEATQNDSLFLRGSFQHRDPNNIIFEGGNAFTNLPTLDTQLNTASADRRMDEDSRRHDGQRVPGGLQLRQLEAPEHIQSRGRRVAARPRERAEPRGPIGSGFRRSMFTGATSRPVPTSIADAGRNVDRTLRQNAFSLSDNLTWIKGAHSLKAGGLWTRNMATRRVWLRREFPGPVSIPRRRRDGESVHRLPARQHRSTFRTR